MLRHLEIYLDNESKNALSAFLRSTVITSRNGNINQVLRFAIKRSFENKEAFSELKVVLAHQKIEADFSS